MRLSNIAIVLAETSAGEGPPTQGPTLDLLFISDQYFIYEYGQLDQSLRLDFINQVYRSE